MFGKLEMGNPVILGNLLLIPIYGEESRLEIIDLETGISSGVVIEEKGVVDTVTVMNPLAKDLFVMDGEELIGAWQDRISRYSVVVEANSREDVSVLCIERGRWEKGSLRNVFTAGFTAYPRLREMVTFNESVRGSELQEKVWASINTKLKTLNVSSVTGSLHHSFGAMEGLMDIYLSWEPDSDYVGMMAFSNRGLLCIDIFPNSELFKRLYRKVLAGYALDAIEDRIKGRVFEFSKDRIVNVFKSIGNVKERERKIIGKNCEQIILEGKLKGKLTRYKDQFIHATLFPSK